MELRQIRAFYYSIRFGSFIKAAEKLNVTQSAISQQIKGLENELGLELFNRFGPRKELTSEGEILFELITPIVQELENLWMRFEDRRGSKRGLLKIAATTVMIMSYLPPIVKRFTEHHPNIKLYILERRWHEAVPMVQSGEVDLCIAPVETVPSNLAMIEVECSDRVLITAPGHSLAEKENISLADIAQFPLIMYERGLVHRGEIDKVFENAKLNIEIAMEATNAETIKRYVELGIGVAIIPEIALQAQVKPLLNVIPVSEHFGKSVYKIVLRRGRPLTSWAENFLHILCPSWRVQPM